jgi:hypothetical protein
LLFSWMIYALVLRPIPYLVVVLLSDSVELNETHFHELSEGSRESLCGLLARKNVGRKDDLVRPTATVIVRHEDEAD